MQNRKIDINTLVTNLKDQNAKKFDIVVPSKNIRMVNGQLVVIKTTDEADDVISKLLAESGIAADNGELILDMLDTAHFHVSEKLNIPKRYYDKCNSKDNLAVLDANVNHWLDQANKNYFLRTFVDKTEKSGVCRAILSDSFKVIDNYDVLFAVLQAVNESGSKLEIQNCDITDKKMFVRFINKDIEIQSPELLKNYRSPDGGGAAGSGMGIVSGFILSNSEVGQGQFSISPRAVVLACQNGMIFNDEKWAKTHLGSKMEEGSKIDWSEETRRKNYELIISQTKDADLQYELEKEAVEVLSDMGKYDMPEKKKSVKSQMQMN